MLFKRQYPVIVLAHFVVQRAPDKVIVHVFRNNIEVLASFHCESLIFTICFFEPYN